MAAMALAVPSSARCANGAPPKSRALARPRGVACRVAECPSRTSAFRSAQLRLTDTGQSTARGSGGARSHPRREEEEISGKTAERQRLFNKIAPLYDELNDLLSLGLHRVWKRMTVKWSRAKEGDAVLDLCCGSGDIALLLAETVGRTGQVIGLDFSPEQLAVATRRQQSSFPASRVDMECRWREGDALALPFEDDMFDAITMGYGLRNVADIPQSLREMMRVLRPGRSAAILDFNNSTNPLTSAFQEFMLDNVVVPIATRLGMAAEYEYLRPSIAHFPRARQQEQLAREAGFSSAVHYEVSGGLMGVLVATK